MRYHDHAYPTRSRQRATLRRTAALRAGELAARPTTRSTTAASSRSTPWPGSGSRTVAVFDESHVEIRRWFDEGLVDGLRVDHPDGLRDPAAYLDDLAALTGGAYVLVEKILEPGEILEPGWATAGTTGYDVLGLIDRVLTDPAGQAPLTRSRLGSAARAVDWPS